MIFCILLGKVELGSSTVNIREAWEFKIFTKSGKSPKRGGEESTHKIRKSTIQNMDFLYLVEQKII